MWQDGAPVVNESLALFGLVRTDLVTADRSTPAATLEGLRERAAELVAGLLVSWADRLFDAADLGSRRRGDSSSDDLTAREQQGFELDAEGLTNAQMADRVFLSLKTVTTCAETVRLAQGR